MSSKSLGDLRAALAPAIADAAAFDGWSEAAVRDAARLHDVDPASALYAFEGHALESRAMAMIEAWIGTIDAAMAAALPAEKLATMKVRERIAALVTFRLETLAPTRESLRRAHAIMAMPQNLLRSARIGWNSADLMWRLAGDTATDYNHYTKRTILASIYAATLAVFVNDSSDDFAETRAFLSRRIDGVMKFESTKARLLRPHDEHFSPARFLGRLRYPAR